MVSKGWEKKFGELENRDHPDYSTATISKNILKSRGWLKRLAVIQTSIIFQKVLVKIGVKKLPEGINYDVGETKWLIS